MNSGAAQAWFIAGTIPLILAGAAHVIATLVDTVRPALFAPNDASVKRVMEGTGMRFRRWFPGDDSRPSMWSFWLGFNVSHGLGALTFGLLCLLIATHDFKLVEQIQAIRPLTIAVSAAYLAITLRYWFGWIVLVTGTATLCFTVAAVLSA